MRLKEGSSVKRRVVDICFKTVIFDRKKQVRQALAIDGAFVQKGVNV